MEQDEKISEYTTMERTLRDTLMTAERAMQDTRTNKSQIKTCRVAITRLEMPIFQPSRCKIQPEPYGCRRKVC